MKGRKSNLEMNKDEGASGRSKFVRSIQKANGIKLNQNTIQNPYSDPKYGKGTVPHISVNYNQTPSGIGISNGGNDSALSGAKSVKKSTSGHIFGAN